MATPSSPAPGAAGDRPDGDAPATREELRVLRRWVVVAGVWAVAATAVALIALLDTSGSDAERNADRNAQRIDLVQGRLDRRIAELSDRLDSLPQSGDVSKLQDRLARAEDDASSAADDAKSADQKVGDLENRVKDLEDAADSGGDSGGGGLPLP